MNPLDRYVSPLVNRNASAQMAGLWSAKRKFSTWRRLWLALAESQQQLGLAVTDEQLDQMRTHLESIDHDLAATYEKQLRHDVMAHVHTFADAAPAARPIIHLGATSQFLNCNTELLQVRDALGLVAWKLACAIDALAVMAHQHRSLPTIGLTHLQPAQPTTVGKRAAVWGYDLALALEEIEHQIAVMRFRGVKGTTGTQASFLALFGGNSTRAHQQVDQLDRLVTEKMGWNPDKRFVVTGQTYPRIMDGLVVSALAATAAACQKFATDVRLLASRKEMEEPFEADQVGSSAMAYKRNPMRCERVCGLTRLVIGLSSIPHTTAAEQAFERTLDDSSTRRVSLPESFLALDGALELVINVARGLVVYDRVIAKNLAAELPFIATENLLMAAVQRGADRQQVHEVIRRHSQAVASRIKTQGADNDLLEQLAREPAFHGIDLGQVMDPSRYVGRAPQQVDTWISQVVKPIRARYKDHLGYQPNLKV